MNFTFAGKISSWKMFLVTSAVVTFVACGEDNGSDAKSSERNDVVSSIYNLGDCTMELDGDTVFVRDERMDYVCQNGKWKPLGEKQDEESDESSSSGSKENSSSLEDDEISSLDSENRSSSSKGSSNDGQSGETVVKDASISGVSQKGPFVNGAAVSVHELDGETLAQTGKTFKGNISNAKGEFSISSVTLASPYAILEASGYFLNEVNGEKSNSTITLNAITDLRDRKTANINLLTHLEYDRVLYLVESGLDVASAKKQAENEIFQIFGIGSVETNSEDLSIFGETDENAALLAVSVLMLGNRSEADLTEFLTNFAADIKADGKWDDETAKKEIAEWAVDYDLGGKLDAVRKNMEDWKFGVVPAFETYVRNFWHKYYGLSDCNEALEGEEVAVEKANNSYSYKAFVCNDESWREATFPEKVVGSCTKKNIGALAIERYTSNKKDYTFALQCASTGWETISFVQYDVLSLKCTTDGEILHSELTDVYYVCKSGSVNLLDSDKYPLGPEDLETSKTATGNIWDYTKGWQADVGAASTSSAGYWFTYTDENEGGKSYIINSKGEKEYGYVTSYTISEEGIAQNQGLLFGVHLGEGAAYYPYVGVGFNLVDNNGSGSKAMDISSWNGLCIAYSSSIPFELSVEDIYGHGYNRVVVPASLTTVVKNLEWSDFTLVDWARDEVPMETVSKNATGIKATFFTKTSLTDGAASIKAVGKLNGCSLK